MFYRIKSTQVAISLFGFVTMSLLVATIGCGGAGESNESTDTSRVEVVDDNAPIDDPEAASSTNGSSSDSNQAGGDTPLPSKPPVLSTDALGDGRPEPSYEVPDGTPEEVMEFVRQTRAIPPTSREQAQKLLSAAEEGLDKVLAGDPATELRRQAVGQQMQVLSTKLEMKFDPEAAQQKLGDLAAKAILDEDPEIVRMGRVQILGFQMDEFISGKTNDFAKIRESVNLLIEDKQNLQMIPRFSKHVIGELYKTGNETEAVELMRTFGNAMKDNEKTALTGVSMLKEAHLIDTVKATKQNKPGAEDELVALFRTDLSAENLQRSSFFTALGLARSISVKGSWSASKKIYALLFEVFSANQKKMFGPSGPDSQTWQLMNQLANDTERAGNNTEARKLYDLMEQLFHEHSDPTAVKMALEGANAGRRRLDLIGKPFEVSGATLDGKSLDWSQYSGKVVLVDFWATSFGPCLAEFPNLEENLKAYREKGFEVIGVNMDFERARLDQFLASHEMLWPSVVSKTPDRLHPLVEKCGIQSLPFVVLVNQDGVVEELHVRGERLRLKLAELLGEPQATTDDEQVGRIANPSAHDTDGLAIRPTTVPSPSILGGHFVFFGPDDDKEPEEENPYLASKRLDTDELIDFILDMEEKPRSIQRRPGFTEAIVDAADRVLAADPKSTYVRIATMSKIAALHKSASFGDEDADRQLEVFVDKIKDSTDKRIAAEVKFLQLERRAINSDELTFEEIEELLEELQEFYANEKLEQKHLRMASSTVHAINRLDSKDPKEKEKYGDMRENYFKQFGELFAKSDHKELARYGKKLAKSKAATTDLVGKPLELEGTTALGQAFNWKAYRGKVVVVDFWATWCGPCRREMPHVKAFYEKHHLDGFEVVGVSLDKDLEALTAYIDENKIPWENLSGEDTQQLAEKYGVRGIPTMMLVDREGKIVAVSHKIGDLTEQAEKLLTEKAN